MHWPSLKVSLKVISITFAFLLQSAYSCNEVICASTVSKCMLLNSCKCDLITCSCCKECFLCLSFLYDECCSCFGLCPKSNITDVSMSKKSHVEDYEEPFYELFQALTEEPDDQGRWTTFTYPIDVPNNMFSPQHENKIKYYVMQGNQSRDSEALTLNRNCTVAFLIDCTSWSKCKQSCQNMGATSYRWFHDGCCECIGNTCINYGINESRCLNCPSKKKQIVEEEYDDYGQDDDYNSSGDYSGDDIDTYSIDQFPWQQFIL